MRECLKKGKYKVCKNCNNQFYVYPYALETRKYCSSQCKKEAYQKHHPQKGKLKTGFISKCLFCDKEFKNYNWHNKIYCSNECYSKGGSTKDKKETLMKIKKTRNETKKIIQLLINKIKNKGNRIIIPDNIPRSDIIEIDFIKKKIIAYEIESNDKKFTERKIYPYRKQFVQEGLVYDKVIVQDKKGNKKVWQNFPAKNVYYPRSGNI